MPKKSARKVVKKELEHVPEFSIKPRNVFIAGAIILLVVLTFALSQTKTSQTAFAIAKMPEKPQSTQDGTIRNLQEVRTEFGSVCKYELFKNGEWTQNHFSSLLCLELTNKVLQ